ncbi:putative glutathione-specific gamma-glutamylcyclotransferase 2 isoform X2 [Condylostylus longicornis]|uniref:putative glutathione-specific gamma-glutamylcyclotransferase 2 isoform X2 n=1 Tax=Condylostylus longicornis TaxID=2530218 RepID=UPI00244DD593|nr:putative glutathione-specific gamma-glutamylcyclotransferase 2 isoform X2 [Condylostylus longicornis]
MEDFPFEICHRGYICNYERRFYQNSLDHRGTPEQPGRVVTCIPSVREARVYGMAYKIPSNLKDEVLSHLDYREKNGYERCSINFFHYPDENQPNFKVIMYIATADNESYAGHISDIKNIAEQIYWAWGPSGSNREYVYNLSAAMKMLFPDVIDAHLFELENELRQKETLDEEISNQIESHLKVELPKLFENNITCNNLSRDIDNLLRKLKRNHYQP